MKTYTFGDLRNKIEAQLDLRGENFITYEELLAYCNDAISEAEAELHRLQIEDQYFLSSTTLTLIEGQTTIDFPSDIYANKVVSIICKEPDGLTYKVKQYHHTHRKDRFERILNAHPADEYQFIVLNQTTPKMLIAPAARSGSPQFTIWYIRQVKRVTDDSSIIEVPEFDMFLEASVKAKCRAKENLGAIPPDAMAEIQTARNLMLDTLANQVSEEADYDTYFEHYVNHS
jgi:hypothetical protein